MVSFLLQKSTRTGTVSYTHLRDVSSKMKFRHPKIFSPEDKQLAGLSWEELKQLEKATEEEPEKAEKP